jgi:hypothetical protein
MRGYNSNNEKDVPQASSVLYEVKLPNLIAKVNAPAQFGNTLRNNWLMRYESS